MIEIDVYCDTLAAPPGQTAEKKTNQIYVHINH